jgi:hypothetical protein
MQKAGPSLALRMTNVKMAGAATKVAGSAGEMPFDKLRAGFRP